MEKNKKKTKVKYIKNTLLLTFIFYSLMSCSTYKYKITPEKEETHRLIRLKINYREGKNKYSGKVIVIRKNENKKIFILNPLGRVHFKLIMNGEKTTAIYLKKRRYWNGLFLEFIRKFWNLKLSFTDFYKLLLSGERTAIKNDRSITVKIIRDINNSPKLIEISRDNAILKIKILKNILKSGKIDFNIKKEKFRNVKLDRLFEK